MKFFIFTVAYSFVFMLAGEVFALHKIAIEGMPGAGKTTTLLDLIDEFQGQCMLLSETNPEPNATWENYSSNAQGDIYHQLWVTRMSLADKLSSQTSCVLFDRSYFSNLAFKFAYDQFNGTTLYADYMELFNNDLRDKAFSLIIVLDISPEAGLLRRERIKDEILHPWTEVAFLKSLRCFYHKELEKLTETQVITICTDNLSPIDLKERVSDEIQKIIGPVKKSTAIRFAPESKSQILKFAKEQNLGEVHSEIVNVLGCPTIYFRRHSVLNHDGQTGYFNNQQLMTLINEYESKEQL